MFLLSQTGPGRSLLGQVYSRILARCQGLANTRPRLCSKSSTTCQISSMGLPTKHLQLPRPLDKNTMPSSEDRLRHKRTPEAYAQPPCSFKSFWRARFQQDQIPIAIDLYRAVLILMPCTAERACSEAHPAAAAVDSCVSKQVTVSLRL